MLHFKRTFKASWGIRKRRSLTQGKVRVLGWNFSCVDPLRQIYWDTCVLTAVDSPDGRRARTARLWIFSCVYTAKFPSPVDIKHVRQRWTNKDGSVLFWFSFLGAWDLETFKQRGLRGSRGLRRVIHAFINRIFIFKDLTLLLELLITKQRRVSQQTLVNR